MTRYRVKKTQLKLNGHPINYFDLVEKAEKLGERIDRWWAKVKVKK